MVGTARLTSGPGRVARTRAINHLKALVVTSREELRNQLLRDSGADLGLIGVRALGDGRESFDNLSYLFRTSFRASRKNALMKRPRAWNRHGGAAIGIRLEIEDLSLQVPPGAIVGIIGPNGSFGGPESSTRGGCPATMRRGSNRYSGQ